MSHIIIDRRKNDKKGPVNRRRYLRRVKNQVKEAVKKAITDGNIKDITSDKGKKINIRSKGLEQPTFHHDKGGVIDRVYPGNKEFVQGDRIQKPTGGSGGKGNKASNDGEGEDDFTFHLTRDEFLDAFFEDLELPDMTKKQIAKIDEFHYRRAGFSVDGNPSRLNIIRSMKQSKSRRLALRGPKRKKLKQLIKQLEAIEAIEAQRTLTQDEHDQKQQLLQLIEAAKRKLKAVPFIDDVDLRYNRIEKVSIPTTQAVMFCVMDVSGSMGQWEKEMAKRFYMLLYLFLTRQYERVDVVFIRHHTSASEVTEEEFFHSRETGGTVVSTGLELMQDIITERYPPSQFNIYACQASDGDNWGEDNTRTVKLLEQILNLCQYYAYVEIKQDSSRSSDLWPHFDQVSQSNDNMDMTVITDVSEIYPVFRKLFEKKQS